MPGATSTKGSRSAGAIQPRATNSVPATSTTPSTATGAIIALALAIAPTSGRVKSVNTRAKESMASR